MLRQVRRFVLIAGITLTAYLAPFMLVILDLHVFKTRLVQNAPPWFNDAFWTLYAPIYAAFGEH